MNKRKDFRVMKWLLFPLNSAVLAGIIAWFNLSVFGYQDGAPYTAIVALIGLFSIIIVKYAESDNKNLARAAFVFEIFLTAALIINAAYSISVQRRMSVARMAETNQKETITEIGKLRGSRTQRAALEKLDKQESAQSVFANVERVLLWLALGELALYGLASFTCFGIARLTDSAREPEPADEFPAVLELEKRSTSRRPELTPKMTTRGDTVSLKNRDEQKTTQDDTAARAEGLKNLRAALKLVGFHSKTHFKVDPKFDAGYLWIRQFKSRAGEPETIGSARARLNLLDSAARMEPEAFRSELTAFLRERGFQL